MDALKKIIRDFPAFLWGGWGALAAIFLFIALWDLGSQLYGDMILPSPLHSFQTVVTLFHNDEFLANLSLTIERVAVGFAVSLVIGTLLGLLAGFFVTASITSRPIITILMGMPPIAWIVLAMIWFGMGNMTVEFTVIVASLPIVFIGALQGTRTLEDKFDEMADTFKVPRMMKFTDIYLPHIFSYIFPAWVSALGMAWKIVVMAELLAASDGIGAALAMARSQLDTDTAMALVVIMIGSLMIVEYIFLEPIKREVEKWRD
ncbi:ABC transporter permease [Nitratifractor salsuginis]|uniref:Binding-protein-dependent transport systems inner membrane component n=1 Tax=Nitratifractor salsuginis (strain DSM 16511 / JCM 12458 / E9I37-1) TaxID=749222 RepID=E6X214_NITSE|nr:ABC transporter permease [Nitratifractor salsuginis]ADV47083.1 binding-protein-dependent transport systems inner membrane component [Nitratifractor salsuginis DSM 16511]